MDNIGCVPDLLCIDKKKKTGSSQDRRQLNSIKAVLCNGVCKLQTTGAAALNVEQCKVSTLCSCSLRKRKKEKKEKERDFQPRDVHLATLFVSPSTRLHPTTIRPRCLTIEPFPSQTSTASRCAPIYMANGTSAPPRKAYRSTSHALCTASRKPGPCLGWEGLLLYAVHRTDHTSSYVPSCFLSF